MPATVPKTENKRKRIKKAIKKEEHAAENSLFSNDNN